MLTLSEWRDIGLMVIAVGFGVLSLLWLIALLIVGRISFRILRALRRAHDARLLGALESAKQRQRSWREDGLLEPQGALELARRLADLRPRRRSKPKRRLWGLLPPAR